MLSSKIVILDSVRSAHNVGSIFRTADGAGVARIILCGYTPTPLDRFGRVRLDLAKTSLGAVDMIPWEHCATFKEIRERILSLKEDGYVIAGVEQTEHAQSLYEFAVPEKVAYILGNEIDGVSEELLALCDVAVEIPMEGKKESLNVGVAAGIVLFKR